MAFSRNDIFRMITRLGLKISDYDFVFNKMQELEGKSEIVVNNIITILDKLDTLDKLLSDTLSTPNFAIVEADVLRYDSKGKPYGILMEMLRISQQLGNLIGIEPNLSLINEQLSLVDAPSINNIVGSITRS